MRIKNKGEEKKDCDCCSAVMNPSKLSQQDYDRYCIIVEDILKDIPIVCDECAYRILQKSIIRGAIIPRKMVY